MDQELVDAAPHVQGRWQHQMVALFYMKRCHDHHLESTTSTKIRLRQRRTILPYSILIWFEEQSVRRFRRCSPQHPNKKKKNKISSALGSVPDPKSKIKVVITVIVVLFYCDNMNSTFSNDWVCCAVSCMQHDKSPESPHIITHCYSEKLEEKIG